MIFNGNLVMVYFGGFCRIYSVNHSIYLKYKETMLFIKDNSIGECYIWDIKVRHSLKSS
jgi:hypothetical protein